MREKKSKIDLLFREIKTGNKSAFDQLFEDYYPKLLAFANQYIKQAESAEDITSELFVKIWLKRDSLSNILHPEAYLFTAIKNACLNLIKSDRKRQQVIVEPPVELTLEQIHSDHGMLSEDKELKQLLDLAVAALPQQRRIIFMLIKEQGMTSNAVAQLLGISKRTVENQLYKAVKTLAEAVSAYLGYDPQAKTTRKLVHSNLSLLFFL